jgi:hypothetical protein
MLRGVCSPVLNATPHVPGLAGALRERTCNPETELKRFRFGTIRVRTPKP